MASAAVVRRERPRLRVRRTVDELVALVTVLARRQQDAAERSAVRWGALEARDSATVAEFARVEERLSRVEVALERFVGVVLPRRQRNAARLREHVDSLRSRPGIRHVVPAHAASPNGRLGPPAHAADSHRSAGDSQRSAGPAVGGGSWRLGTAFMYAGVLVLVWLVLWQVALAVGFH